MSYTRLTRLLLTMALVASTIPAVAVPRPQTPMDIAIQRASVMRRDVETSRARAARMAPVVARRAGKPFLLAPGDLLSGSTFKSRLLRLPEDAVKVVYGSLKGYEFVPRGVRYDPATERIAIAAISQVLLFTPATGEVVVVSGPEGGPFAFANDVLFDGKGGLIIADQGNETTAIQPLDGAVWRYDLETGALDQIGLNKEFANPKLLALDKNQRINVVDGGAGDLVATVFDVRWDLVYRLEGKTLNRVKVVWNQPGIQATAYAIDGSDWQWFVNVGELVRFKKNKFLQPCLPPYPLQFATGLVVDDEGIGMVADGADVLGKQRGLYTLDDQCAVTLLADRRLKGSRGLAYVPSEE